MATWDKLLYLLDGETKKYSWNRLAYWSVFGRSFWKAPLFSKVVGLDLTRAFQWQMFRPWSLDKKGAPNSWLYSRLFMGMTPWHLNTLVPCILISWHRHWNGKHWTLGFDPPILTTSKVKKWWLCRNCVKILDTKKKGEGGRKSISPALKDS